MATQDATALLSHFRPAGGARPVLVGRERELAELTAALDAAIEGSGSAFLIAGEPGIGKTRLAETIGDRAADRNMRVAWGRCWEAGGAPAHWPWVQAVRTLVEGLDGPALARKLGPQAGGVVALAPELRDRLVDAPAPAPGGPDARFAAWDATTTFLARAGREQPLVIVLDDMHAADLPSLLLLRFAARSLRDAPVVIVAALRDTDAAVRPGTAEIVADLSRDARRIDLGGLDAGGVGALAAAQAGRRPSAAFARDLRAATDGNPFWVEEVVRLCASEAGDPFARPCLVPTAIGTTLATRVAGLPAAATEVLVVAAVIGRDWEEDRVQALSALPAAAVATGVAAGVEAGLVHPHAGGYGRHRFAHALVRDAFYARSPDTELRRLHRTLAESLERDAPGNPAPLAHHFAAARDPRAYGYSRSAGQAADAALAHEEAAEHYQRALALAREGAATEDTEHCDLLLALGHARMRAGDTTAGREAFRRAAASAGHLDSPERTAAAALGFGSGGEAWANGQVDADLVDLLEEALRALPRRPSPQRALVLARLSDALLYAHDWARTDALSREGVDAARACADDTALVGALSARLLAIMRPATIDERRALTADLTAAAERTGSAVDELGALSWRIALAVETSDGVALDGAVARTRAIADELRQPHMLWGARLHEAMRATLLGRLDDAERLAADAIAVAEGVVPVAAAMYAVQVLGIRRDQGRQEEVEPGLRAFVREFPAVRAWRCTWAAMLVETGADQEARAELDRLAREDFLIEPEDYEWPAAMTLLLEAFARLGDAERCATLYERLLPYADRTVVVSVGAACGGPIARHLGLGAEAMGDEERAAGHFRDALDLCERLGARGYAARTRFEYGRMLVRSGSAPEIAAGLLAAAASDGEAMGLEIGGQARALLSEHAAAATTVVVFSREGDFWTVGSPATPVRLRDAKGMRHLAELLGRPGEEIAAADLAGARGPLGNAGPALDPAAKRAYRRRVEELRAEADEAAAFNDPERATRAREELDAVGAELRRATGLGGRDRSAANSAERARLSVTKAIRTAIGRIADRDAELGDYLQRSVRTGAYCAYEPPARGALDWRM